MENTPKFNLLVKDEKDFIKENLDYLVKKYSGTFDIPTISSDLLDIYSISNCKYGSFRLDLKRLIRDSDYSQLNIYGSPNPERLSVIVTYDKTHDWFEENKRITNKLFFIPKN